MTIPVSGATHVSDSSEQTGRDGLAGAGGGSNALAPQLPRLERYNRALAWRRRSGTAAGRGRRRRRRATVRPDRRVGSDAHAAAIDGAAPALVGRCAGIRRGRLLLRRLMVSAAGEYGRCESEIGYKVIAAGRRCVRRIRNEVALFDRGADLCTRVAVVISAVLYVICFRQDCRRCE